MSIRTRLAAVALPIILAGPAASAEPSTDTTTIVPETVTCSGFSGLTYKLWLNPFTKSFRLDTINDWGYEFHTAEFGTVNVSAGKGYEYKGSMTALAFDHPHPARPIAPTFTDEGKTMTFDLQGTQITVTKGGLWEDTIILACKPGFVVD